MREPVFVPLSSLLTGIDAGHSPDVEGKPAGSGEWGVLKVSAVGADGYQPQENKVVHARRLQNPAFLVRSGDLLITRANTPQLVGLSCIAEETSARLMLSDKTLRLRVNERIAPARYVQVALGSSAVRRQIENLATGTSNSMKNISQSAIKSLMIPFPGTEEANRIAEILNSADMQAATIHNSLAKFHANKMGAIHAALSPHSLRLAKSRSIGDISRETALGTAIRGQEQATGDTTLVKMGSLRQGIINLSQTETIQKRQVPNISTIKLHDNDLLFNTRNTPELVGKAGVWHGKEDGFVPDNNLLIIRFNSEIYADYACLQMTFGTPSRKIRSLAIGTTSVAAIYWRDLKRIQLPVPDDTVQLKVVDQISLFDEQIKALESSLSKVQALKQGLMDDLLTGRVRVPVG